MPGQRVFAAINISDEVRQRVWAYVSELRQEFGNVRVGWERPAKLHLTLKFYGDVDETQLETIRVLVDKTAVGHTSFTATIAGTGVFPSARKPRILWLGIQGDGGTIEQIGREIEAESSRAGFKPEIRPYSPHLTIGRIREPEKGRGLAASHIGHAFSSIEFEIKELVLYESKLLSSGSVYAVVSRHELRGA